MKLNVNGVIETSKKLMPKSILAISLVFFLVVKEIL